MGLSFSDGLNENVITYINKLEERISNLEKKLGGYEVKETKNETPLPASTTFDNTDELENQIGQFWFAKVGILVLFFCFIYILTFPFTSFPSYLPGVIGFLITGVLLFISRSLNNSFELLANYIFGVALILFYFSVVRLHYFSQSPAIGSIDTEAVLLFISCLVIITIAMKRNSHNLILIGISLICISALIANYSLVLYAVILVLSFYSLFLIKASPNTGKLNLIFPLIYFTLFWYSIGNYFLSEASVISFPLSNIMIFIAAAIIINLGAVIIIKEFNENAKSITHYILNTALPIVLLLLLTLGKYKDYITLTFLFLSILFLAVSIIYWIRYSGRYSTFIYAMTAYAALSVSIISFFPKPDFFIWLCWQSFLVVSTSIMFRSKFIVVANFIIYVLIYFAYLVLAGNFGIISLSFGFVALLSARILNWQKHRLELTTDMMRIAYLAAAFFIFPYALYHIVPPNYVSISWIIVAIFYSVLGVIFKNNKYRWMSILTFFLTALYVITLGSASTEPEIRIFTFLFLGIALTITSIYYAKKKKNQPLKEK